MPEHRPSQVRHGRDLRLGGAAARVVAVAMLLAAIAAAYVSTRWALAETVVDHVGNPEILERAVEWQAGNPDVHRALGVGLLDASKVDQTAAAVAALERAAALGPNRHRVWMDYGRGLEGASRPELAAAAYLRAGRLAPSSWQPWWHLGNLRVRQGRAHDAVGPFRQVADLQPAFARNVVRTLWLASAHDLDFVVQATDESPVLQTALVDHLASDRRIEEAADVWERQAGQAGDGPLVPAVAENGRRLADILIAAGKAPRAIEIFRRIAPGRAPEPGVVTSGDFEGEIAERPATPFEWLLESAPGAVVSLDAGRGGGRALRIQYSARESGGAMRHASQLVAVEPGARYELRLSVRAEGLTSGATPLAVVVQPGGGGLATTPEAPTGTYDWRELSVPFRAPAGGIVSVAIQRGTCGTVCPILGVIWVDDVRLVRVE